MQNEVWEIHHTQLNRELWLTFIKDIYSHAIAGYRLYSSQPTAEISVLCLRSAILSKEDSRWYVAGIPGTVNIDYDRASLGHLLGDLERVAVDLSVAVHFSSQSNINEYFVEQAAQFASHTEPGSTLALLTEQFQTWVLEGYHRQIHPATGESPKERWEARGFLPKRPISSEALDLLLLLAPHTRRVQPRYVSFAGLRYEHDLFRDYVGEEVQIRFDPADMAEVKAYLDGEFLCRAICLTLADRIVSLNDLKQLRNYA